MQTQQPSHDEQQQRYVISMDTTTADSKDNEVVVRYKMLDADRINFTSTYTPPALRGQGLARKVVEFALDDAESKNLQVTATCWYVEKLLKERQLAGSD